MKELNILFDCHQDNLNLTPCYLGLVQLYSNSMQALTNIGAFSASTIVMTPCYS